MEEACKRVNDLGEGAFIPFITAGDPDLKTSARIILELEKAGADIIELGIPFSDPMADGPTIQASSDRALKKGTTIKDVIALVRSVRLKGCSIPIILFGYYNPIFVYGVERFAREAGAAGVDGALVVDLPPEESEELLTPLKANGLDLVFTLTPTSDEPRMKRVAKVASGFIYYVTVTGVTGARNKVAVKLKDAVKRIRKYSPLPVGIGFGISTPEQVRSVSRWGDGVVVGSAIIDKIVKLQGDKDLPQKIGRFAKRLKQGTKNK
ncbi:MAG: tryptophan synthase subunit alpha [Thermodesulfobacteriota bacterium]